MFMKFLNWIFNSLSDDNKGSMSLVRLTYLIGFIVALNIWKAGHEIPQNFYYFLLILVTYLLFKYKALDIVQSIINIISVKKDK